MSDVFDPSSLAATLGDPDSAYAVVPGPRDEAGTVSRDSTFISSVTRLIAGVRPEHKSASSRLGVALLLPTISSRTSKLGIRIPMMDSGKFDLAGRLTITNEVVNFGWAEDHELDDDEVVERVLSDNSLCSLPTVVYDPTIRVIRFYPVGLEELGTVRQWSLDDDSPLVWEDVEAAISTVVEKVLATPAQQIPRSLLWEDASKYHTAPNVEAHIQSAIKSYLIGAFPLHVVEHEGPVDSGRFDLALTRYLPAIQAWRYEGILELKVLRFRGSGGRAYSDAENRSAARSSVGQAWCYTVDKHALWGAACCFDMRRIDDPQEACFQIARPMALILDVELRRWKLFNSPTEVREVRIESAGA